MVTQQLTGQKQNAMRKPANNFHRDCNNWYLIVLVFLLNKLING